jgi:hypothetical protein
MSAPIKGYVHLDGVAKVKKSIEMYLIGLHKGMKPLASSSQSKKYGCQGHKADGSGCQFEVRLTKLKDGAWNTSFVNLAHVNCAPTPYASNVALKELLQSTIYIDPNVQSTVLKQKCASDFGIHKSLRSINRAKNDLKRSINDDSSTFLAKLPSYLSVLTLKNPGTIACMETLDSMKFHRAFVMLRACVDVAISSPKKVQNKYALTDEFVSILTNCQSFDEFILCRTTLSIR